MTVQGVISFAGALLCSGLAAFVFLKNARSVVRWTFVVGMIALALEEALIGLSAQAVLPETVIRWQRLRMVAAAALPGSWFLFSLSFARANYKAFMAKWRWVLFAAFIVPLALATVLGGAFFLDASIWDASSGWVLRLGWSGHLFFLFFLLGMVFILMNLERTLRASTGTARWQIKFMILGLGGLFAARVYTSSQALLFSAVDARLDVVNGAALLVADGLLIFSLLRAHLLTLNLYLSQAFLYNSLTVLIVGIYLLAVGILPVAVNYVGGTQAFELHAFLVFLALMSLTIVLLSDQLRHHIKRFLSRHFQRPRHDYRKEWTAFTRRTTSLVDIRALCAAVAKMVSETFGTPSVTIWLWNEAQDRLLPGASTVFSDALARGLRTAGKSAADLIRGMREEPMPVDCDQPAAGWVAALMHANQECVRELPIRYCVPLVAGREVVGIMTLNERLTKEPFSFEDFELLKTVADQAAGSLLTLNLSQRLMEAKEMEAFQTLSAFFLHDLKNLASTLSLTMQNLPEHFDDPAFRHDALRAISHSVAKIHAMCSRLSLLSQTLELEKTEADLTELVAATLAGLNGCFKASLIQDLRSVPRLVIDPQQMRKVLTNLVLNANESVESDGEIRVTTETRNGWVVLSVSDNGCGMSREFMERSLFRPFQTTKEQGLGIGLFHSKRIVEAHGGWFEVKSKEGKGSTFQVILPAGRTTIRDPDLTLDP